MEAVKLSDSDHAWYVIEERRADGRVILRPETPLEGAHRRQGSRAASAEEFDEILAPYLLPADDEG